MNTHHLPERVINSVASFLSSTTGFLITFVVLIVGIGIGALLQFNDAFMFGFNILLSVAAIVISGIILVSGARSEAALHVKLEYLIEFSKASNKTVGLEHKSVAEIERERHRVESEAGDAIEEAVEEEVAEQLDERAFRGRLPATGSLLRSW
jgi:low affinity Fe/Cu permease